MRNKTILLTFVVVLLVFFSQVQTAIGQSVVRKVITIQVDGPLTPSLVGFIDRGVNAALQQDAELLIIQLNTPGGSIDLMNRIVQKIRQSSVPVVVYVSPSGAMAGSAGTFITLAGHLAAMAPETTIGAASPVGGQGEDLGETIERKEKEILRATVRTLAADRGEQAIELAEATVENAKAASANEALSAGLIDIIASNLPDLLEQIDGRQVKVLDESVILHTQNVNVVELEMSFIEQLLQLLTNPNILFLLLTIGVQAIFIELSNPGGWVAGFIGAVCLILAIYGMGVLPVNWFGILFIMVAFVLFVLEIKAVTHGALSAAGAVAFIVGTLVLFNSIDAPGFPRVSVPLVITTGVLLSIGIFVVLSFAIRAMRKPVQTGMGALVGKHGYVVTTLDPIGNIQAAGELWGAMSIDNSRIIEGEWVEITGYQGNKVIVKRRNLID
ncbi:MAG: hypothetical protein BGO78_03775 [Chloroflexi bacterium 44-23]|nr:MAG: hypothetical protein BGO78_03775 [Chloroflexi bacterium 44-23]